jgi:predicted nucleic acid-binding protein
MCRLKLFLPSNNNNIFNNLVDILYGKEKVNELKNKTKREHLEKELNKTVLEELQTSFNKSITHTTTIQQSINNINQQNDLINQSTEISTNVNIFGFSLDLSLIIKYIEIAFLLYYIYGFCMSM